MESESVVTSIHASGVATITLNRPRAHNAFDETMIASLTKAFRSVGLHDQVRLVILAAEGRNFCAGADLHWMRRAAGFSEEENLRDALAAAEMLREADQLPQPLIAKVQGLVLGGGVGLVATADIVIAAEDAEFGLTEVLLGLIPAVISPYVIRSIGVRQARRFFLTAERFPAAEARRLGLVHETAPAAKLEAKVEEIRAALLRGGPKALRAAKDLVARVSSQAIDEATIRYTAERIAALRAGDEAAEGISAFFEKRPPHWRK
jgi:methylglutaconyl-CoA hydratase